MKKVKKYYGVNKIIKNLSHKKFHDCLNDQRYMLRYKLRCNKRKDWIKGFEIEGYLAKLSIMAKDHQALEKENKVLRKLLRGE